MVMAGTKLIFWDMRENFIDGLYKLSVPQARMEKVVGGLDPVSGNTAPSIVLDLVCCYK